MKKRTNNYLIISILILLFQSYSVVAQTVFQPDVTSSKLEITGTSSLHDWEMNVEDFDCAVEVGMDDKENISIQSVDFSCLVEEIKSHNKIMDSKTYKAIDNGKHPKITFSSENQVKPNGNTVSSIKGELLISGVKKMINLDFSLVDHNQDQFKVKGDIPLKMSDFGIEPPTAMMGTMKTGDDIVIHYEILFRNAQLGSLTK